MKNYKQGLENVIAQIFRTFVGLAVIVGYLVTILGALVAIGWLTSYLDGPGPADVLPFRYQHTTDILPLVAGYAMAGTIGLAALVFVLGGTWAVLHLASRQGAGILERRRNEYEAQDEGRSADDELRQALLLADQVTPSPTAAHAALMTLRARLAAAQGVTVDQLIAKAVQP